MVEEKNNLVTVIAVLIALTTVIAAILAWRASVIADAAGDADYAGLRASINAEETHAINFVDTYEHYSAFTNYNRYNALSSLIGDYIDKESNNLSPEESNFLNRQMMEASDQAEANHEFFPGRFIKRDGSYNLNREMGEMWADAAKEKDLNPEPQFAEADRLSEKTQKVLGTLVFLACSLVFFTLVENVGQRLKIPLIIVGTLFLLFGTTSALIIGLIP